MKNNEERRAEWTKEGGLTTCSLCHYPAPFKTVKLAFGAKVRRVYHPDVCPHCKAKMMGGEA